MDSPRRAKGRRTRMTLDERRTYLREYNRRYRQTEAGVRTARNGILRSKYGIDLRTSKSLAVPTLQYRPGLIQR